MNAPALACFFGELAPVIAAIFLPLGGIRSHAMCMLGADNAASWSWLFRYCLSPLLDDTVGISSAQEIPIRTAPSFAASIPWDSLQPPSCSRFLNFQIQLAAAYVNRAVTQRIAFESVFDYQLAVVRSLRTVPRFTPWEPIELAQHSSDSESDVEDVEDRQAFHWAAPLPIHC